MDKVNTKVIVKTTIESTSRLLEKISPFQEMGKDLNLEQRNGGDPDENRANELFGYFTADIIKENVIFIR